VPWGRHASSVGLLSLALLLVGVAQALAVPRYAAPTPAGTMDCSSPANACSYVTAVNGASASDEVILAPGDYGSSGAPIATNVFTSVPNVYVHGVLGQPRPRIFSSAIFALELTGTGSVVRWLEIDSSNTANGVGLDFRGTLAEQVVVHRTMAAGFGSACRFNMNALARNDVCQVSGAGAFGVVVTGVAAGPNAVTLRNVTAIAQGIGAVGVEVDSAALAGRSSAVTMINTIARADATGFDVRAIEQTEPDSVTISHSNYVTTSATGGATITDDGTSQTATPLFAAPLSGDYHELSGSPTIDAGISDAANGDLDADGAARTQGASVDIGAFEFPFSAPAAPVSQPPIQVRRKKCKKKKKKRAAEVAKKKRKCKKKKKKKH
jgi:hypothetical protein